MPIRTSYDAGPADTVAYPPSIIKLRYGVNRRRVELEAQKIQESVSFLKKFSVSYTNPEPTVIADS
ncbi:MAG: hypothetical protein AABZ02_01960 [Bacteroidota bacterium]